MDRILKIVYCNPALHVSGGGERVLTVKANYFAEKLGYEIHIVTTDGGKYPPFFTLHPSVKVHQLNINYDDYFLLVDVFGSSSINVTYIRNV